MSIASALGITSAGRIAALLAAVAAASAGCGFWAGMEWQRGQTAQAQVIDLRADANTLRDAVAELRQQSVYAAQDMRIAAARMDAITFDHWSTLNALDELHEAQRAALDDHLATAAAAELRACRIGDIGLQLWAAAAAGQPVIAGGTAGASAEPPARQLPGGTSDAGQRQRQSGAGSVDSGGADLPPLPREQGGTGGVAVDL